MSGQQNFEAMLAKTVTRQPPMVARRRRRDRPRNIIGRQIGDVLDDAAKMIQDQGFPSWVEPEDEGNPQTLWVDRGNGRDGKPRGDVGFRIDQLGTDDAGAVEWIPARGHSAPQGSVRGPDALFEELAQWGCAFLCKW